MDAKQSGFTIIELLTACAILSIIIAIAIPTYQNYRVRAQVAEGVQMIAAAKLAVRMGHQEEIEPPYTNAKLGLPAPTSIVGNNVASVTISEDGIITVAFTDIEGGALAGKFIQYVPTRTSGSLIFRCDGEGTTVEPLHRPANCR